MAYEHDRAEQERVAEQERQREAEHGAKPAHDAEQAAEQAAERQRQRQRAAGVYGDDPNAAAAYEIEGKAAGDPVVADFPEGMSWYPGGRAVASPLAATPGVHAGGTPVEAHPATVKVAVLPDGSALVGVELLGAPALPIGAVHIPQDKLADVIAALSAVPVADPEAAQAEPAKRSHHAHHA
jgi:hypothetical protein